MLLMEPD